MFSSLGKNNNDKNSSNSGKPSSKDGFKKVIHTPGSKTTKKAMWSSWSQR